MSVETLSKLGVGKATTLKSAPVRAEWILEGTPVAKSLHLSGSVDGTANSYIWECTAGRFKWHYDAEETIYVLEGSTVIIDNNGVTHRIAAGDTIFFPSGAVAEWQIDNYIRKFAIIRSPWPKPLMKVRRAWRSIKRLVKGGGAKSADSGLLGDQA